MVQVLAGYVRFAEALSEGTGRIAAFATLGCVLVCFAVVILRYGFGIGLIWMQELYIWMHAFVFLIGAAYTLRHGGHVRVDAFYSRMSLRRRAIVDLTGTLVFLLPWLAVVGWFGADFVADSLAIGEASAQPGGMPALYLLKGFIPAFCVLLALQGLALAARSVLVLAGREEWAPSSSAESGQGV